MRPSPNALNLQKLLQDVAQLLAPEGRRDFRAFVQKLKQARDRGQIPSMSAALLRDGPAVVGRDVWDRGVAMQAAGRGVGGAQRAAAAPADRTPDHVLLGNGDLTLTL